MNMVNLTHKIATSHDEAESVGVSDRKGHE